jgi:hypothetical protein
MPKQFLLYARVFNWHDGDTFHGILDHGCFIYQGTFDKLPRYRCAKIQAPELGTPGGDEALAYANKIAPPGEYQCWSTGLDVYGRPLIDLIVPGGLFSELMLIASHAKPYKAAQMQVFTPGNPQPVERSVDNDDPLGYLFRPDGDRWPKDDQGEHVWAQRLLGGGRHPVEDDPTIETDPQPTIDSGPKRARE